MAHAAEDQEASTASKLEFWVLLLALGLGAAAFDYHTSANAYGVGLVERSEFEAWSLAFGVIGGIAFLGFAGLFSRRFLPGKKSKRKRRHRRGSHRHRSHRDHGDGSPVAHDGKSRNDTEDGSADADGSGGDGGD